MTSLGIKTIQDVQDFTGKKCNEGNQLTSRKKWFYIHFWKN